MVREQKNIWVAAGDGDLQRVQELIQQGSSANAPDPYTYTPMHAAASYGHLHILEYLISQGGDVNVTDSDGDTPLYTVETVETARWLVQHGATVDRINIDGITPAEQAEEDFPDVATFLRTVSNPASTAAAPESLQSQPSQHSQDLVSEQLTSSLMNTVQDIMERAERDGTDPDEALRAAVGRTVLEGVVTGYEMSEDTSDRRDGSPQPDGAKRPKTNGSS